MGKEEGVFLQVLGGLQRPVLADEPLPEIQ